MKNTVLILAITLLAGCTSVPVVMKFPDVPSDMLQVCPDLKPVDPTETKLSAIITSVVDNYGQYYDCKDKSDNWIEWYKGQKKLFDSIK